MKKTPAQWKEYYQKNRECSEYHYDGPLGAEVNSSYTMFRLWSPLAEGVRLCLYTRGDEGAPFFISSMEKQGQGVWTYVYPGSLHGTFYLFALDIEGETLYSQDPYARACGVNGKRSMVVDLRRTNPEGWERDKAPQKEAEDVIYELHVKEFSWAKEGGFEESLRGTYKAFTQRDTHLNGDSTMPKTGLSYVKELGVNTLQIMPMYDYGSVDEAGDKDAFNWGYDPMHYNVPEGSYASDPYDGQVRIREAKEMIKAMHDAGFRVIMDVVYNHTFSLDTCLQKTMPWYYYRVDEKGESADGSGCGNEIATERSMVRKYIEDSVLYWAQEYHMDGFRFDLMGLLDVTLMNRIRKKLDALYGEGEKLIYGEPWSAAESAMEENEIPALKEKEEWLLPSIGMFQDDLRDGIKGSVFEDEDNGFINGKEDSEELVAAGILGFGAPPSRWINYVSCHDNYTLWDKLSCTTEDEQIRKRQYRLAACLYMMSLGRPFLLSGEEFLRTKEGLDNSFDAPVTVNCLNWKLILENRDMVRFYQGLIGLRKKIPALCAKDREAAERLHIRMAKGGVVCFDASLKGEAGTFSRILVCFNSNDKAAEIPYTRPEEAEDLVLLKGEDSHLWEKALEGKGEKAVEDNEIFVSGKKEKLRIPPGSCLILGSVL